MKALSIKQPYAELILLGKKKIELRRWNTNFRGEFIIHASKIPDKEAMEKFGFFNLALGCIVGKVNLVDVKKYKNELEHNKDKELHLASSAFGNYGFVLKDVKGLKPIPCKGNLGFWKFDEKKLMED